MKGRTIGMLLVVLALACACGGSAKLRQVRRQEMQASLGLSRGELEEERRIVRTGTRDTITYRDPEGREVILMKAVLDEDTGEMVAHEVIDAAVITARFRNIAERLGTVDIRFDIHVPAAMQDSRWQLRLSPRLYVQADTLTLPEVIVTGADYRKEQLRGYRMYERYLRSIITDSTRFVDWRNLRIWIERNLSDKESFGPDEQAALLHYTRKMLKRYHRRKWEERDKVFSQYVHSPIITEGVRLDTVLESTDEDLLYEYVQTLRTRPRLKKVEVVLSGAIYEDDVKLYTMPDTPPLAFYISSLSDLASPIERYVKKVVERRVTGHTSCELAFRSGRWELDEGLADNRAEMARIRKQILELEGSETFLTDSIVIEAFDLDAEGRVVFRIKDAFRGLPPGRYHGELRFCPPMEPMCLTPLRDLGKPKTDEVRLPEGYEFALNQCGDPFPDPPPPPPPPARCCVVASFGIDLAPSCGDHYVDQIAALIPEGCMEDE